MTQAPRGKREVLSRLPGFGRTYLLCAVLLRTFARAFGVEAPSLRGLSASEALATYRDFTAACMRMAQEDVRVATLLRARLGEEALLLGGRVRRFVPLPGRGAFALARWLYGGIGIGLAEEPGHGLRFVPCSFAERYTPADCWFMSAFDEGFLRGLLGREEARLLFSCRLTEGADCCRARFCAHEGMQDD